VLSGKKQSSFATAIATQMKQSNAEKPHKIKRFLGFLVGWGQ